MDGRASREMNWLDIRNRTETLPELAGRLISHIRSLSGSPSQQSCWNKWSKRTADVITGRVREAVRETVRLLPYKNICADSLALSQGPTA